jgi:holo-[acyl-carrier protein] synthase
MLAPEVCGIGIDILELSRFRAFLARSTGLLGEIFTQAELSAAASQARGDLFLATRWALKEAVLKALGTGWGGNIEWRDVEAVGGLFGPRIVLHGSARQVAQRHGAHRAVGSAASSGGTVMALVVLVRAGRSGSP